MQASSHLVEAAGADKALVLATYNVHRCVGRDGRFAPERVVQVMRELNADVMALQELNWQPGAAIDQLREFATQLGYEAIAGPTLRRADGHYGNALLTRRPVSGVVRLDLSLPGREPRGALDVLLQGHHGPLRLICTHLGLNPRERRQQIEALLAALPTHAAAVEVLLGDLNEWFLWGRPLRRLRRHFGATPAPATFPAAFPVFALDRVWVWPRHRLVRLARHQSSLARVASDHLPLRAVVRA